MKRTPLFDSHVAADARMVPFGGWDMPVQYPDGIIHEVRQVRTNVGLFDVSHMARFEFSGEGSGDFLDTVLSVRASRLRHGQAKYHLICNANGGIIDDAIVYNLETERYLLVVNAGNADTDREWLLPELGDFNDSKGRDVTFIDLSARIAMIAVQGPNAVAMIDSLSDGEANAIRRFRAGELTIDGERILAARTGYTGEDGFEIMCDSNHSATLWQLLTDNSAAPCGLGARDVLRLEAGLMLHGSDMTVENNPYEAGLDWTVQADRPEYIASEGLRAIREAGAVKRIAGFKITGRGIARHGHPILSDGGVVGEVTSGTFSPTLGGAIGMGYIPIELTQLGTPLTIDVRGRHVAAEVAALPFVSK